MLYGPLQGAKISKTNQFIATAIGEQLYFPFLSKFLFVMQILLL